MRSSLLIFIISFAMLFSCSGEKGAGTSVFIVERENGNLSVVDYSELRLTDRIETSGNLRHASMVFSPDLTYGYIVSRDGVISKINLHEKREVDSLKVSENSIAIAISQDGRYLAAANYKPGSISLIDLLTFKKIQTIPAEFSVKGNKTASRVTGLVDAPGNRFVCSLMDSDEIWILGPSADANESPFKVERKIKASAKNPFDALITSDGRYYIAGHFKQDRVSLVDLWSDETTAKSIIIRKANQNSKLAVKMPHMEGWAVGENKILIPVTSDNRLYAVSYPGFQPAGFIDLIGAPVYAVVRPDRREVWVTFSGDDHDGKVQIIDLMTMKSSSVIDAGKRIYHLVFTPRGDRAILSSNESNEVVILDAMNYDILKKISVHSPSGIFGIWRAFQIGL